MNWLEQMLSAQTDWERQLVERYTQSLLELASKQMPERLRRRMDPEDVVQSVYRSFFRRFAQGQFRFDESQDIWRLLATITLCKARNAVKFHGRQKRYAGRDVTFQSSQDSSLFGEPFDPQPGPEDLAAMTECLEQLLNQMTDRYRRIVVLRLEGYEIAEIAEQAGVSRRTVLRVLSQVRHLAAEMIDGTAKSSLVN